MKFEELKKNYLDMDYEERKGFILTLTDARAKSIAMSQATTVRTPKARKGKDKMVKVSNDQLELLKALGLL